MKKAQLGSALKIKRAQRWLERALRMDSTVILVVAGTAALIYCLSASSAAADPLTVMPVGSGWERFNPTLELPRIYNSDGSLPSNAEMPALTPDESSPDPNLPLPDALDPSASEPASSTPAVTHGDPPTADGSHHDAASASGAASDSDSAADASLPEPDPETMLSEPSALDPTDGTDQPPPAGAQNNQPVVDANGNPVGSAQEYQEQQVDAPSVVLVPPPSPYYGAPMAGYGYPYYGSVMGAYSSFSRAPAGPPPIPANAGFGVMPPPGYPWLGPSSTTAWTASHPPFSRHLGMRSSNLFVPKSHLSLPSIPIH